MTKFNKPRTPTTLITTNTVSTMFTHEGAPGFGRDNKSELFLLGVSNFVSEKTFYEDAKSRDARFEALVRAVAVDDVEWMAKFIKWLRHDGNMRSASLVAAAEAVKARLDAGIHGHNKDLVSVALERADEPGEFLGYWVGRYGRKLPMPVKRGIADAVARLYNEYAYIKYDNNRGGYSFADIVQLVHARPVDVKQGILFRQILNDRYKDSSELNPELTVIGKNRQIKLIPVSDRRRYLVTHGTMFNRSGFTWEQVSGWIQGSMDREAWEVIIPHMGYMALLRNLRNFEDAGISYESVSYVNDYLSDPERVARSRQFPFRFMSARNAVSGYKFLPALERALDLSLSNIPQLKGNTLILVDRSGSMFGGVTNRSTMDWATMAAVFGSALAKRCDQPTLVEFGTDSALISFNKSTPVQEIVKKFGSRGGTETTKAVRQWFKNHDRVVILTDEQAWYNHRGTPGDILPANVPLYTWNFAGYRAGHTAGGNNRYTFGGLTDAAFKMISLLEHHRDGKWPWDE